LNPQALAELRGVRTPPLAKHLNVPGIWLGQTFTDFDRSRLPSAIRSEKTEAFARLHFKVEAIDRKHVLVCFSQVVDAEG